MSVKEMLDNIPKTNDLVSAYGSINVDDLQETINRFKKVPNYDELLKENKKQKEVLDKIKEISNQVKEEAKEVENEWTYQVMKEIDYVLEEIK